MRSYRFAGPSQVLAVYGCAKAIERQQEATAAGCSSGGGYTRSHFRPCKPTATIPSSKLSWLVLGEADEMLNMGFIQDVEKILSQAPADRSDRSLFSRHGTGGAGTGHQVSPFACHGDYSSP
jgi:ATP-dependent RNA helicase DeaD